VEAISDSSGSKDNTTGPWVRRVAVRGGEKPADIEVAATFDFTGVISLDAVALSPDAKTSPACV
jgi:hypothetical protein